MKKELHFNYQQLKNQLSKSGEALLSGEAVC